jgi:flagellar hook assembly protein FlgD
MRRALLILAMLTVFLSLWASVTVLESTANHILLEYKLDGYTLSEQGDFIRIDASGLDYAITSGAPLLPLAEIKVGIPPSGSATAHLLSSSTRKEKLTKRLQPVPEVFMNEDTSEYRLSINEQLYSNPGTPFLNPLGAGSFRGLDYIPLELHPFTYDGYFDLAITDQALIRIDLGGQTSYRGPIEPDEPTGVFLSSLVNPDQARYWRSSERDEIEYADFSRSDFWIRLETDREGMFKLTPSQLSAFPLNDVDPRSFRLFTNGGNLLPFSFVNPGNPFVEVPLIVAGESDGSFDSADYIAFYGTTRDGTEKNTGLQTTPVYYNPYSGNCVYWLTFAGEFPGEPLRIQTQAPQNDWVVQTSSFREKNRLETESQRREVLGFEWYMTRMFSNSTSEYEFNIELPNLVTANAKTLSFAIRQEDVDVNIWHNINVYVNGVPVAADTTGNITFTWRGTGEYVFYKEVSNFVSGTNTIRIKVNRSSTDNLFLNWITVDYTRSIVKSEGQALVRQLELNYGEPVRYNYSVTGEADIYRVKGIADVTLISGQTEGSNRFYVSAGQSDTKYILCAEGDLYTPVNISLATPTDLAGITNQYDNVIITADEFAQQAQSLADMYLSDLGKHSLVVKQSDVFNQFNGGHPDPAAIRQFLRYASQNYSAPHLSSVTLLGLGSIDWRNFSNQAQNKNKLIIYQRNQIASDDYFVMLTQTSHPELAIGRYPVTNATELNNMLTNFSNYVENPQGGWWRNSMVFLGDDLFNGSTGAYENIHTRQTESAADVVHPSILTDRIFAWEYEYDEFQNKPTARDDMMAAINDGRLVWYYIGHGSYDKLGAEDYFNGASDMGRFNNPGKLPFFMAASCKVSHFDYWGFESLGQKVVLMNNLGAIASYSATRVSSPYNNAPMMELLLDNLANDRYSLGNSIMYAKTQYTQSNDNDATYVLLGDPLLNIVPPVRDSLMTVTGQDPENSGILHAREQALIDGRFAPSTVSATAEVKVFNTETEYDLDWQTHVSHRGAPLFTGSASVTNGHYQSGFIVPDDVTTGNTGLAVSYLWDPTIKQDYTNFEHPLSLSDEAITVENPDSPTIELFLGSLDFRPGDTVGTDPVLYAKISDSNGINVTGSSGHNILLILDDSLQPVPVTQYFNYSLDSFTDGLLTYPIHGLEEGSHSVKIIAFDNFNLPSVASTSFIVKKSGELSIERFLIYPNPMQNSTSFTFMLSRDCDLNIDIFTVSGKKVHSFKTMGRQGFNAIPWNGRDDRGDSFANNTYFVKVRATADGLKAERTERLVVYK